MASSAQAARPSRIPLTSEELRTLPTLLAASFGYEPREFQTRAVGAQLQHKDTIVHAGTGFGKTAIAAGPHFHGSAKGGITLMISPLIALHDEQVETFRDEFKLSATAVNSSHGGCSKAKLMVIVETGSLNVPQEIVAGRYQIVLISPEMCLSRRFIREVLQNPVFGSRLLSVVVDEAHVVSHWGAHFRKKYGQLGMIRAFLPRRTPIVALSATLSARIRDDVLAKLQFHKTDFVSIDVGNDRPNVSLVVRAMQHPMNTYADLDFVIPSSVKRISDVKKTFVYADSIQVGIEIEDHLEDLLPERLQATGIIRPYNAAFSKEYRQEVMRLFTAGAVRVLVCTDAAGMGCNIPDIDVVVQWKLPASLSSFVQRAGRAARGRDRVGLAVLLVEPSAYLIDLMQAPTPTSVAAASGKAKGRRKKDDTHGKRTKKAAIARGLLRGSADSKHDAVFVREQPPFDWSSDNENLLVFVQTGICRRQVLTSIYKNQKPAPSVRCCDLCAGSLLDEARPGEPPSATRRQSKIKRGIPHTPVQQKLLDWRRAVVARDFPHALFGGSAFLMDDTVELLASVGAFDTEARLERVISRQWKWYSSHGRELYGILKPINIPFIPSASKKSARGRKRRDAPAAADASHTNPNPPKTPGVSRMLSLPETPPGPPGDTSSTPRPFQTTIQFIHDASSNPPLPPEVTDAALKVEWSSMSM
ncbi:P-loop containing nucleoside triphosphate hydrolase protein [Schizophyllum fasciatum]